MSKGLLGLSASSMGVAVVLISLLLSACVANTPHRAGSGECVNSDTCTAPIERHQSGDSEYILGVAEFDDQGDKLLPEQMEQIFGVLKRESLTQDLCIVVFVHGWKHNAASDDDYVKEFRTLLKRLSDTESAHEPAAWGKPRKIVGIYAGWRGRSLDAGLLENLTFWTRKATAERVAQGSIRELLARTRAFHDTLNRTTESGKRLDVGVPPPKGERLRHTRMLTIGHSFGGLIVYNALKQYFTDHAAAVTTALSLGNPASSDVAVEPYGDLVVIVNPAVEAITWQPIYSLVKNRNTVGFAPRQNPVFIEVTSSADDATGTAFPLGRTLNTVFESFTDNDEKQKARTAFGHYDSFVGYDLTLAPDVPSRPPLSEEPKGLGPKKLVEAECAARSAFEQKWMKDGYLQPGWTRRYSAGAVLTHRADSGLNANDPYWIVRADPRLIADHSDITEPAFVDFVRQVYDELSRNNLNCATE